MSQEQIKGLIIQLHERIGDDETSPQQARLLARLQGQLIGNEEFNPGDGDPRKTAELLLDELDERHPKASMVLRDIIESLRHLGL